MKPAAEAARPLTPLERWYWICDQISPLNVIGHVRVRGRLPEEVLGQGLDALQARHPLLRTAIHAEADGSRPRFVPIAGRPIPLRTVCVPEGEETGEPRWQRELNEHEFIEPVDWATGPLARAVAISRGEVHDLIITVPHCVADGTTVLSLLRQWLHLAARCQTGDADGSAVHEPARALPGPEGLLPPEYRGLKGAAKVAAQMLADQSAARRLKPSRLEPSRGVPFPQRTTRLIHHELDGPGVEGLTQACKRERTTVHGLLAAAMVTAVAEDAGTGPGHLTIGSPITFREALEPSVTDDELGTYVATVPSVVAYRPGQSLWPMARAISRDLARRRNRGEHLTAIATMGFVAPKTVAKSDRFLRFMQDKGPITLCLSNLGRFDFPHRIGPWQVSDAEFVTGLSVNAYFVATVNTSHDRLAWNFTHVDQAVPRDRAARMADASVEAVLAALT
ncbi:short-chain dehydrogenase [Streptomyces sp. NPDC052020]|uniref:phthiocerol/phthiodiolone dimycocerosyl transferase family protein n=1 Tax=Streptomyces sp. NPDC052020 TaxID=3155677 RepID=UPI0034152D2A